LLETTIGEDDDEDDDEDENCRRNGIEEKKNIIALVDAAQQPQQQTQPRHVNSSTSTMDFAPSETESFDPLLLLLLLLGWVRRSLIHYLESDLNQSLALKLLTRLWSVERWKTLIMMVVGLKMTEPMQ
jgi:hypothetical protein